MNNKYVLSLDQGTTSSRAILFNHDGKVAACAQREITQFYPEPGWVEQDPEEIWRAQVSVAREVIELASIHPTQIVSIGIANQRETIVLWDKESGKPVYRAIVWQCRRSTEICEELREKGLEGVFRDKTGLRLDPYFSGTKLSWLFRQRPELLQKAERGELLFGTVDSWLIWKLTGLHETDITNASRTLLLNIHEQNWDEELLSILGIPPQILPELFQCSDDFGYTKSEIFGIPIPITGVAGDQQASLFGHACFYPGMAKNTYGTGCFSLLNTGEKPLASPNNLLSTIAWKRRGQIVYALEGSVFIGGSVIQWLRDSLRFFSAASDSESLAKTVENSEDVFFVPAFVGLGAPYWDPNARGAMYGLTRGTTLAHIVRAALESIAYQSQDLFACMGSEGNQEILTIKADGGATNNRLLMQFQADISGIPVIVPENAEITALGAAFFAGLHCGFWDGLKDLEKLWKARETFEPAISPQERNALMQKWHNAIRTTRDYAK